MTGLALFAAVFLACVVEAVEALTIILAAGTGRDWRSALKGMAVALAVLVLIVAALGPAVAALPLTALRLVVGGLLLVFGIGWLRKAVLRASGNKALHDEDAAYAEELAAARSAAGGRSPSPATGTRSPSPSRASCSKGSKSSSSPSPSAATSTTSRSRPSAPQRP
ncbi:hypothetical protein [Sinomonas atrocyanea]